MSQLKLDQFVAILFEIDGVERSASKSARIIRNDKGQVMLQTK